MEKIKYIAIGTVAGCVNGLFGAGGGLLLVPLLTGMCRLEQKQAFATSLCITLPLSVVSLIVCIVRGGVDFATAVPYMAGGIVGGLIGGSMMRSIHVKWLKAGLAVFLLYGGIKAVMLW